MVQEKDPAPASLPTWTKRAHRLPHCLRQPHAVHMPSTEHEAWQRQERERYVRSERMRTCRQSCRYHMPQPCRQARSRRKETQEMTIRHDTIRHVQRPHDASEKADAAAGGTRRTTRLCCLCRIGGFSPNRTAICHRCDRIVTTHGKTTPRRDTSDGTHAPDGDKVRTRQEQESQDGLHGNG